jgi:hypothetical protein
MTNSEKALRLGIYAGLAAVKLGDHSFARQFVGRRIADVSPEEYFQFVNEVQQKLVAAGVIQPDEDPYDEAIQEIEQMPVIVVDV